MCEPLNGYIAEPSRLSPSDWLPKLYDNILFC